MNTVTIIHLAGRSYTLEEAGYTALKAYLASAEKNLEGNPDKEEIMKDFDMAVAEKCERYLNANKNVITAEEVQTIIKEMGPVENSAEKDEEKTKGSSEETHFKKLYRIREGQMISGVCTGLAAYFNMDITLVRLIFVALLFITHGGMILVYIVMILVVPVAHNATERAQASGIPPITAQDLLQKAKAGYSNFKSSQEWRRWKQQMKEEKKQWKQRYHENRRYDRRSPFFELVQSVIGLIWFAFILWLSWFGYYHIGAVREFFDMLGIVWHHLLQTIAGKFGN